MAGAPKLKLYIWEKAFRSSAVVAFASSFEQAWKLVIDKDPVAATFLEGAPLEVKSPEAFVLGGE